MASLGPFYRPVEEAPPWDWNPGATFMRAFNDAQENKRLQEKAEQEAELNRILFPAKKAQAEFTIKQLAYETERMEKAYQFLNEDLDGRRRLLRESRSGGLGAGGGGVVSQDQQPQQQLGYSNRLRKTGAGTLGSGLQPIQPVGGN